MPFRRENRNVTLALVLIIVSLFVVTLAVQLYADQRQDDKVAARLLAEEQEDQRQDASDRKYANCLAKWASGFYDSVNARTVVNIKVERAEERKSVALDRIFDVVVAARATPPAATEKDFDAALQERVAAQQNYLDVKAQAVEARAENPYRDPANVCNRDEPAPKAEAGP